MTKERTRTEMGERKIGNKTQYSPKDLIRAQIENDEIGASLTHNLALNWLSTQIKAHSEPNAGLSIATMNMYNHQEIISDQAAEAANALETLTWDAFEKQLTRNNEAMMSEITRNVLTEHSDVLSTQFPMLREDYTKVLFSLLRTKERSLAIELRERIISGQDSIESLSLEYGRGPERFRGGMFGPVYISELNSIIREAIEECIPMGHPVITIVENQPVLVRLISSEPPELSDESVKQIILHRIKRYTKELADGIASRLSRGDNNEYKG